MSRRGLTLIELLTVMSVMIVAIVIGKSGASAYGVLPGIGAGFLDGSLTVIGVILFYCWS